MIEVFELNAVSFLFSFLALVLVYFSERRFHATERIRHILRWFLTLAVIFALSELTITSMIYFGFGEELVFALRSVFGVMIAFCFLIMAFELNRISNFFNMKKRLKI